MSLWLYICLSHDACKLDNCIIINDTAINRLSRRVKEKTLRAICSICICQRYWSSLFEVIRFEQYAVQSNRISIWVNARKKNTSFCCSNSIKKRIDEYSFFFPSFSSFVVKREYAWINDRNRLNQAFGFINELLQLNYINYSFFFLFLFSIYQ